MNWLWKAFADLSNQQLYDIIQLRERIFIVEQNCPYLDCDGNDNKAWHLMGYKNNRLVAYLRAFPAGVKYREASLGRVVTAPEIRGEGLGKMLMQIALEKAQEHFGESQIRISAQSHLEKFYNEFGFVNTGKSYLEDNIPHIEMFRK